MTNFIDKITQSNVYPLTVIEKANEIIDKGVFFQSNKIYDYQGNELDMDKVSKSGDTMTGGLALSYSNPQFSTVDSNITRGTAPAEDYIAPSFRIKDSNGSALCGIDNVCYSDNANHRAIKVWCTNNSENSYSIFEIGFDASGNRYCSFPNTTRVDGQWVDSQQSMISTAPSMGYNDNALEYRIDLPNDGHIYEVMVGGKVSTGSTSGNFVYLTMRGNKDSYSRYCCGCRTRTASSVLATGTVIVTASYVASGSKNLYVPRSTNYTGTLDVLNVMAYRRIGTNS